VDDNPVWACPVCGEPLLLDEFAWVCPNRHSYDVAREGYVNLLLANQKRSPEPGDSSEMVQSRSRFLGRGHYAPLAERLTEVVAELAESATPPLEALDSGCGEGYFLSQVHHGLEQRSVASRLRGIDVSRPAIRAAARRDPGLLLAVASVHRLPLLSSSLDVLLRVLAPIDATEFRRALRLKGHLLSVTPGPSHLYALRELVYETPKARAAEETPNGFVLAQEETLAFPIHLTGPKDALDLLAMTPYYWHAPEEAQARLRRVEQMETGAEFVLSVYTPR
jgi:23S rRNA (guanine745-N1)-methyltransferase